MNRAYYSESISNFLISTPEEILGKLSIGNTFSLDQSQRDAWLEEIDILRETLKPYQGTIYFEFSIPRMGQRIDIVLLIGPVIFVLEFKIGANEFTSYAIDQVWDYALDLKNFHESSHEQFIAPILIATEAENVNPVVCVTPQNDRLLFPVKCNAALLAEVIKNVLNFSEGREIDHLYWKNGRYCPTPTIIEAAMALYNGHAVEEISRNDASAINLGKTSEAISSIIRYSRKNSKKSICLVTGVPGAGKTLVGLNIATTHIDKSNDLYSVFLSGNGPLVAILREALTRDKVLRNKENGIRVKKGEVMSEVKMFIQNVHHFRDDCLIDIEKPPIEHVALFDEAQRAWDKEQTSKFMRQKKKNANFSLSEPEFLISCLDRHLDWAVIVCLIGGGQEINTGEAGIGEWIDSLNKSFPNWHIYISPRLSDSEYVAGAALSKLESRQNVVYKDELHLAVSMRSFRAENVSLLVKQVLDFDIKGADLTPKNCATCN
ncbi:MAG: DNA/RNA helicase domain-containing protein [Sedimentisphaerales bacterium]